MNSHHFSDTISVAAEVFPAPGTLVIPFRFESRPRIVSSLYQFRFGHYKYIRRNVHNYSAQKTDFEICVTP